MHCRRFIAVVLLCAFSLPLFSEPTITVEGYNEKEHRIPVWAKDLRRTEIITLGSLPFTTLGTKAGYTIWRYFSHRFDSSFIPNPLAKTSDGAHLDSSEQKKVFAIAISTSLVLGITDFTITQIKRGIERREARAEQKKLEETVVITAVEPADEEQ